MLTDFIGLVIVLRIILEDFGLFCILKILHELIHAEFTSPLFIVDEPVFFATSAMEQETREFSKRVGSQMSIHLFACLNIEFPCPKESQ